MRLTRFQILSLNETVENIDDTDTFEVDIDGSNKLKVHGVYMVEQNRPIALAKPKPRPTPPRPPSAPGVPGAPTPPSPPSP